MKIKGTFPKYKIEFEEKDQYHRGECTAYIDLSKCKDYKPEWQSEAFDLIARIFRVDIEKVAHAFGVIYENDIPTKADAEYYKLYSNNELKEIRNEVNSNRWKPNGITDNREEWKKKWKKYENEMWKELEDFEMDKPL